MRSLPREAVTLERPQPIPSQMPIDDWLLLGAVTFLAAVAQAATGFGFALIVTPFLVIILSSTTAIQVTIAVTTVISLVVVPQLWRAVRPRLLVRLIAGSVVGFPVGVYAFVHADLLAIKLGVGVLILCFTVWFFAWNRSGAGEPSRTDVASNAWHDLGVGAFSGALAATLGMPGPPVLIYLLYLRLHPENLRGTLLSLFAFTYPCALGLHASLVGIGVATWTIGGVMAPIAVAGGLIGHVIAPRLGSAMFRAVVLSILFGAGLYTVYSAVAL